MNEHQTRIIRLLESSKGDDTARARAAFQFLTPEEMNQQHGMSGHTRAQVLAGYEKNDAEIDAAIAWVKGAK